jgi:hypothetical protein
MCFSITVCFIYFIFVYNGNSQEQRGLIDWCLTPTLAIFQLYRGMNKEDVNKHMGKQK